MINLTEFFQTINKDKITDENAHLVARSLQKFILQKHTDLYLDDLNVETAVLYLSYVCTMEEHINGDFDEAGFLRPKASICEVLAQLRDINNYYLSEQSGVKE